MKYLYLIGVFSLISFSTLAQSKDEKPVAEAVEKLRKAMVDADKAVLENAVVDNLSYGHSTGRVENKAEFIENLVSGKSDFVSIDLSEQTITISKGVAVVRHILNAVTNDGGKPGTAHIKILMVLVKEKGQWKLLARQAVKFT